MDTYNGWSNYATWKVNLELLDGMSWDMPDDPNMSELEVVKSVAAQMESYVDEMLFGQMSNMGGKDWFVRSVLDGWLRQVDWRAIAEHYVTDYWTAEVA